MSVRPPLFTRAFVQVSIANLFHGFAFFAFVHLPGYLQDLGALPAMVGVIFGIMSGAAVLVRPFAGSAIDRAGRRVVIVAAGALHVVACLLYLTVHEIGLWIFVVRCLHGLAQGALFSALFTYAADIVPPARRSEGIGIFGVSGMLPLALGGLIGDVVLQLASYATLFVVTAAIAALALFVSLGLPEPVRDRSLPRRGFLRSLTQPDLLPIWMLGILFACALAGLFTFIKSFVEQTGFGSVGAFFATYAAVTISLRVLFGRVPDRFGPLRVLYPSMVCFALATFSLAFASSDVYLLAAAALGGVGHGYVFPILSTMVFSRVGPADRGSAMSLFTAVFDTGMFAGGPLLGFVAGPTEDYRSMYMVASILPLVGTVAFAVWDRRVRGAT